MSEKLYNKKCKKCNEYPSITFFEEDGTYEIYCYKCCMYLDEEGNEIR